MFWNGALAAKIVGGAVGAFAFVLRKGGNVLVEVRGSKVVVYPADMNLKDAQAARDLVVVDCERD